MKIAIIGAGAAGYFSAINIKELNANHDVTIFESSSRSLSKVAVSGGGRCNLTNTFAQIKQLKDAYPRGEKLIKRAFKVFDYKATYEWFENHGIKLTVQDDECIFPHSQSAEQIVDLFTSLAKKYNIEVKHSHKLQLIEPQENGYELQFCDAKLSNQHFDTVIVTTGGAPKIEGLDFLKMLNLKTEKSVPSLFSFNLPGDPICMLMGTVVENAKISIQKSKLTAQGTILITHWGMSGPAVLRLSSYGARLLDERNYQTIISVNWCDELMPEQILSELKAIITQHKAKKVTSIRPFNLPSRLWAALLEKSGISSEHKFAQVGSKGLNRLVNTLSNDEYKLSGQTRFRDEFVTCGGVSLSEIDLNTCQSKAHKGLFFAGEVLDIDAITGGFNLQAAWSTAYVIAQSLE